MTANAFHSFLFPDPQTPVAQVDVKRSSKAEPGMRPVTPAVITTFSLSSGR